MSPILLHICEIVIQPVIYSCLFVIVMHFCSIFLLIDMSKRFRHVTDLLKGMNHAITKDNSVKNNNLPTVMAFAV